MPIRSTPSRSASVPAGTREAIPAATPDEVPRTALLARLDRVAAASGLVLVSAPAGYGKTTLLAQMARAAEGPVVWVTVRPAHRAGGSLISEVTEALSEVAPGSREPVLLVLDDVDARATRKDLAAVKALVRDPPPGARIALGLPGRSRPPPRPAVGRARAAPDHGRRPRVRRAGGGGAPGGRRHHAELRLPRGDHGPHGGLARGPAPRGIAHRRSAGPLRRGAGLRGGRPARRRVPPGGDARRPASGDARVPDEDLDPRAVERRSVRRGPRHLGVGDAAAGARAVQPPRGARPPRRAPPLPPSPGRQPAPRAAPAGAAARGTAPLARQPVARGGRRRRGRRPSRARRRRRRSRGRAALGRLPRAPDPRRDRVAEGDAVRLRDRRRGGEQPALGGLRLVLRRDAGRARRALPLARGAGARPARLGAAGIGDLGRHDAAGHARARGSRAHGPRGRGGVPQRVGRRAVALVLPLPRGGGAPPARRPWTCPGAPRGRCRARRAGRAERPCALPGAARPRCCSTRTSPCGPS